MFKVHRYTAHISSNGSHFLAAGFSVYCAYRVSKIGYGWTKLEVTMYNAHTS